MRARKRKHRVSQTRIAGEPTEIREQIERAWFDRRVRDDSLARLVTAQGARIEPLHRWLVFRQAFSPELVRLFLSHEHLEANPARRPLLDPFCGTGTFVTECARRGAGALGVDPLRAPAFVAGCKTLGGVGDPPDLSDCVTCQQAASRLDHPIHRAALICALASQLTAAGTINKNAQPIGVAFDNVIKMMRDDLTNPLPRANPILPGDGRDLNFMADASIGGILTSPPYLSRHDYIEMTRPYEDLYARWYPSRSRTSDSEQLPAHPRARPGPITDTMAPVVAEIAEALNMIQQPRLAKLVKSYFADLFAAVEEIRRVLASRAPCWIVIAGARLKDVHVPTDIILAEHALAVGFEVQQVRVARRVSPAGRRFGTLTNVAPRESVLIMYKR